MSRIAYVNGTYVPHAHAAISIDDRAHYFGDAIYEVIYFNDNQLVDAQAHFDRLIQSLEKVRIPMEFSQKSLELVFKELIRRNTLKRGIVYFQISRGTGPRDHLFPKQGRSSLVALVRHMPMKDVSKGVKVMTSTDMRWENCNIKCTALLANVLAKQNAADHGAYENWFVNHAGHITEGSCTNAYMVTKAGEVWTYPAGKEILSGVIRKGLLELAPGLGIPIKERAFTLKDLEHGAEAFLSSTTQTVVPVVQVNEQVIGSGKPGPITMKLRDAYIKLHNLG
jgi:D-alanine transaminase